MGTSKTQGTKAKKTQDKKPTQQKKEIPKNKTSGKAPKPAKRHFSLLRLTLKWSFFLGIWLAICGVLTLLYYLRDLPSLTELESGNGKQIVQINYSNGSRITNHGGVYSSEVRYFELPQNLINAVIATEDRRFFSHCGVDFFGITRAYYANHRAHRIVQGGSTITQQLAKLLFLKPERTAKRKVQEILLALQLERQFTKEQILTLYLNRAYFGSGNYGIGNAAKFYFGKEVSRLTLNESAIIAGLLKAPSKFSPKNNHDLAESRSNVVLQSMIDAGFLDEKNIAELDQDVVYHLDHSQRLYFADFVQENFSEFLSRKQREEKVIRIITTLDESVQERLESIADKFAQENFAKIGNSQIAVLVMKKDGEIVAMSGGKDYQKSQFNRAVNARRQAGSAFKAIVYLTAFEVGMTPDDVMEDKKISVGSWLPDNYENRYFGEVSLENAFANSLNSVSIQLAKKTGGKAVVETAKKFGISAKIDSTDPTIALGTTEVSMLELTGVYATIANGGRPVFPYAIREIRDGEDRVLYGYQSSEFNPIISSTTQKNMKQILRKVVTDGTGKNANVAEDIYGKTGTSQNFRDAWFIGFDDSYVVGVWIGNDDNSSTNKITGGSLPATLFGRIIGGI